MLRKKIHHEGGFTIVEIMVTIVIVAIVTAIAVPAFLNQRKKGYDKTLETDMATVGVVVKNYSLQNGWDSVRAAAAARGISAPQEINTTQWNQIANAPVADAKLNLPKMDIDPSSKINILYKNPVGFVPNSTQWTHPHNDGDFCLVGLNTKSNYNYPGGNAARYNEHLYWDQMQGDSVKTADELVTIRNNGTNPQLSCSGYINGYKIATGK